MSFWMQWWIIDLFVWSLCAQPFANQNVHTHILFMAMVCDNLVERFCKLLNHYGKTVYGVLLDYYWNYTIKMRAYGFLNNLVIMVNKLCDQNETTKKIII